MVLVVVGGWMTSAGRWQISFIKIAYYRRPIIGRCQLPHRMAVTIHGGAIGATCPVLVSCSAKWRGRYHRFRPDQCLHLVRRQIYRFHCLIRGSKVWFQPSRSWVIYEMAMSSEAVSLNRLRYRPGARAITCGVFAY
jgi:hypothetical protein